MPAVAACQVLLMAHQTPVHGHWHTCLFYRFIVYAASNATMQPPLHFVQSHAMAQSVESPIVRDSFQMDEVGCCGEFVWISSGPAGAFHLRLKCMNEDGNLACMHANFGTSPSGTLTGQRLPKKKSGTFRALDKFMAMRTNLIELVWDTGQFNYIRHLEKLRFS